MIGSREGVINVFSLIQIDVNKAKVFSSTASFFVTSFNLRDINEY